MKNTIYLFLLLFLFCKCSKEVDIAPAEVSNERDKFILPTQSYQELETGVASCIPIFEVTPSDSSVFPQWCPGNLPNGTGTAFREDHFWNATAGASNRRGKITVYLSTADCETTDYYYGKERLQIQFNPNSERCISLNAYGGDDVSVTNGHASFRYIDLDVTYDRFATKKDESNLLEITRLDTINNIVEGHFMITFKRSDELDFYSIGPEVFSFVNGSFSAKIRN